MARIENLFFDLDGSLTDPKEGIVNCIHHACRGMGCPLPANRDLDWCVGPPLSNRFFVLLVTQESAAVAHLGNDGG